MRLALVCLLIGLAWTSTTAQLAKPASSHDSKEVDAVKAQEEAFRQAELRYDTAVAGAILADDFVLVSASDGKLRTKNEFLPLIGDKADPMEILEYGDMVVHVYGVTAVVFSNIHEKFIYEGKTIDYRGPRTAIWIKKHKRWILVALHASSYPAEPLMQTTNRQQGR